MNTCPALSNADQVREVAHNFFRIADLLHRRLNAGPTQSAEASASTDLYRLLVEEYGLRSRAAILLNDAGAHIINNATLSQQALLELLANSGVYISQEPSPQRLRSLVASVNTLCAGISPGKGHVIDYLAKELRQDLRGVHPRSDSPNQE